MKAKLAFISAHGSTYSIRLLCAVLGVARSWFHDWQASDQTRAAESRAEADLVGQIRGIFQDNGERYGAPRIHAELQANGVRIARKRVARLIRENGLRPPRRRKRPPITAGTATVSPRTFSSVPSRLIARIRHGSPTSRMWPRTRAGCTWLPSRTWPPAKSSAGASSEEFLVRERADDGDPASRAATRPHPSLRPRRPIRLRTIPQDP
jgi:hypothetical protein